MKSLIVLALALSSTVFATDATLASRVAIVGVHDGNIAYFTLNPTTSGCGIFYLNLSTNLGSYSLPMLLQARASGDNVTKISFTQTGAQCTVTKLETTATGSAK